MLSNVADEIPRRSDQNVQEGGDTTDKVVESTAPKYVELLMGFSRNVYNSMVTNVSEPTS